MNKFLRNKALVFLLIILAIAALFRLWHLSSIPPGLYPDVAINGNDALNSLENCDFKIFYPENNGREGLFIWLIAGSFWLFGVSVWSIKIVAAICGILTVLGLYLLVKEILQTTGYKPQATGIALLSSFFLATSFWHTNFSRIGFRAILLPFILVFSFYFLFKGLNALKEKQSLIIRNWILAGIFLGLGFYTYISFRLAVLIIPFILIPGWLAYKRENLQRKFLLGMGLWLITVFIVALPVGIYFLQNPQNFISRAADVSVFSQDNPIGTAGISLFRHLLMFFSYGDYNWRHNFAGDAMLPPFLGIIMYVGILIGIKKTIKSLKNKDWQTLLFYSFLISWFFALLLPSVLTFEGIPHALRSIGVIPVAYIFVAIGIFSLKEPFKNILVSNMGKKYGPPFLLFCIVILTGYTGYHRYFINWANNPNVEGAFTKNFADIGYYLNSLPFDTQKYVIVNEAGVPVPYPGGIPMPAQTPMFIESTKFGHPKVVYLLPGDLDKIQMPTVLTREIVIVPMKFDESLFKELEIKFPQGQIKKINEISVYEIK